MYPSLQHRNPVQDRSKLFIADYLARHKKNSENRNEEIPGINLSINAIEKCTDILECMMAGQRNVGMEP